MAIFNLFSKRQKRLRGEVPDVYTYDSIPDPLRVQIVHIWDGSLGDEGTYYNHYNKVKATYRQLVKILCREYGVFRLTDACYDPRDYRKELISFLLQEQTTEKVLDAIEISFRAIDLCTRESAYRRISNCNKIADGAISELNHRFKEHGVGYQYEDQIIRVDSQLLHAEAVKPALTLLNEKEYAGAQQEFLSAYEHYRHGKNKEALNDALKAFESTLKAICDKRGWAYGPTDTSKNLIDICFKNDLVPRFWQSEMSGLRSLLEGGVPTGRNKLSGHGQGSKPIEVPEHIVSYVLHMAAAAIVFLVRAEQNMK
jgi:hypothetical protein